MKPNLRCFTPFLLLAALTGAGCAPLSASTPEIPFQRYRLQNGLTVILHEDHRQPQVALNLWYYVGSKDESPGRTGFAHLFEHLMFMGTQKVPQGSFDRIMETAGGSNNASTSSDRTNYYEQGPSNLLETLLFLESDRLRTLGRDITVEKLNLQRDIVRNERRQSYENRPYGRSQLEIWPLMYPENHPYHWSTIGSHEDLEAASLEDVKSFFARFYMPGNAALVISGDFDSAQTRKWIETYFGDIPGGEVPKRSTAPPAALQQPIAKTLKDRVQLSRTTLLYHSPPEYAEGNADLDLAAFLLGGGKSSRLYRRLVYEKSLAQDVDADQHSAYLGSLFIIQATARPGVDLGAIEKEIDAVIAEFLAAPPSDRDVTRARNKHETSFWHGLESIAERADILNSYQFQFDDPGAIARDLARYEAATPSSLHRWSKSVLGTDKRLTLRVVPEEPAARPEGSQ